MLANPRATLAEERRLRRLLNRGPWPTPWLHHWAGERRSAVRILRFKKKWWVVLGVLVIGASVGVGVAVGP